MTTGFLSHIDFSVGNPADSIPFYETFLTALGYVRWAVAMKTGRVKIQHVRLGVSATRMVRRLESIFVQRINSVDMTDMSQAPTISRLLQPTTTLWIRYIRQCSMSVHKSWIPLSITVDKTATETTTMRYSLLIQTA